MGSPPLRAVVTGATSGLGREMARQLARRGWKVALTGRRKDALEETAAAVRAAGGEPLALHGSVADPGEVAAHYARIEAAWGGLDWAVLNAGVGDSMDARAFRADKVRWAFETNLFGVCHWLEAVLPGMIARGSGVVAAVSSLAAFRGLPRSAPYCASKAALNTLLESVRVDLRGTGVSVVTVCPGFVKSELTDRNAGPMPFLMETEDGAAAILAGIEARRRLVHFPWPLSLPTRHLLARLPGPLYDRLAAAFLAPLRAKKSPAPGAPR